MFRLWKLTHLNVKSPVGGSAQTTNRSLGLCIIRGFFWQGNSYSIAVCLTHPTSYELRATSYERSIRCRVGQIRWGGV